MKNIVMRIRELTAYPARSVMDKRSAAVSPRVVAEIFMIQNDNVIWGSLLNWEILWAHYW
jgi:hypothetical protein